jgi:glycosyltransferase involved in cell wall biosynthesis
VNVTVSVLGRFHAFDLARELDALGSLERLITSYPTWAAARFGVDRTKVASRSEVDYVRRLGLRIGLGQYTDAWAQRRFERTAPRLLPARPDVVVAWSGVALSTLREAKRRGATTVVERGSAHIVEQSRLLTEEYRAFGIEPRTAARSTVERELIEYAEADAIAVPSEFVRRTFIERGFDPERLLVNPYGVDLSLFTPPREGRPTDGPLRVIAAGRACLRKGTHRLIQAFEAVDHPTAELHFVGPIAAEIEPFRARIRSPRIHFHGSVPQADLVEHYGRAHLFCLPSIEEGMAMVTFQAMGCALPCLVTPNTGAEGLVRDGHEGWIVDPGSTSALTETLARALEDRTELNRRGAAAAERVRAGFGWADYGARAHALYSALRAGDALPRSPLAIPDPEVTSLGEVA